MARRPQTKRAMLFNQDELETLKNLVNAAKILVYHSLEGSLQGKEIKDLETTLNAFGKALIWDNEKVLDPKVKY
jgi:uncharacterized protein (DUF488 family)